jgi:uncharacterized protein
MVTVQGFVMNTEPKTNHLQLLGRDVTITEKSLLRRHSLGELLREASIVDETTLEQAELLQRDEGIRPVEAFLSLGVIEEQELVEFLCRRLNLAYTDLEDATIDLVVKLAVPELPLRYQAMPWSIEDNILHVAMADPTDLDPVEAVLSKAGRRYRVYCATPSAIKRIFEPGEWVPDCYTRDRFLDEAKQGNAEAQFQMGLMNYREADEFGDYETALKWWLTAAASGHSEAAFNIAKMYHDGVGVSENKEIAVAWCRRGAEQGHADAQFALGWLHAEDTGILKNYQEAAKWYRMAAEQGDTAAQNNLGILYANGQGVPQDNTEAARWYRMAVEKGSERARYNLAYAYESGAGVPKDTAEAVRLFRASAEQGLVRAQIALAERLQDGYGIARDEGAAVLWFWKAAQQGDAYAQYRLGDAFENGRGVWPDRTLAMKWYRAAARQGHEEARHAIRRNMGLARSSDAYLPAARGDWELYHYPVVFRTRGEVVLPDSADAEGRIPWSAEILGWPDMRGTGDCEEDAYMTLEARFLEYKVAGDDLPAPVTDDLLR